MVKVEIEARDLAQIVHVEGEVDLYSSPELRQRLLQVTGEKANPVVVDLQGVKYMDSSGVATLVEALQAISKYSGRFLLAGMGREVRSVFELSRLDQVFDIHDTVDGALGSV